MSTSGSFAAMVLLEQALEHGQLILLVAYVVMDKNANRAIHNIFRRTHSDHIGVEVNGMQRSLTPYISYISRRTKRARQSDSE